LNIEFKIRSLGRMSSYAKLITDLIIDLGSPGIFMFIRDIMVIDDRSFNKPQRYEITPDKTILRIIFPEKKIYCP
jgi:hypothetical protein